MQQPDRFALEYVIQNGTPWEVWRAQRLLGLSGPLPPGWAEKQNPDGGWQSREFASPVSNMGTTSVMLMRMVHSGLGETEACRRTVAYLWKTQKADGRWTEDPVQSGALPPEWNEPGDETVDLWETANNAACLAALGFRADPRLQRAVAWVQAHARADGAFPGYLATTHAMAAVCHMLGQYPDADRYLEAALALLQRCRTADWFDVMDLTWALILWNLAGIGQEHAAVGAHLAELQARRQPGGTWVSRYHDCDVQYTLEAMEILQALGN